MSDMSNSDLTISHLHEEARRKLKSFHDNDPEFVNYLLKFGNEMQRATASVMKRVATASNGEVKPCR